MTNAAVLWFTAVEGSEIGRNNQLVMAVGVQVSSIPHAVPSLYGPRLGTCFSDSSVLLSEYSQAEVAESSPTLAVSVSHIRYSHLDKLLQPAIPAVTRTDTSF